MKIVKESWIVQDTNYNSLLYNKKNIYMMNFLYDKNLPFGTACFTKHEREKENL